MRSLELVLSLALVAVAARSTRALECYTCLSEEGGSCDDPFDGHGEPTCTNGDSCAKAKGSSENTDGKVFVARACVTVNDKKDYCATVEKAELFGTRDVTGTICYCPEDKCNSAPALMDSCLVASCVSLLTLTIYGHLLG